LLFSRLGLTNTPLAIIIVRLISPSPVPDLAYAP